MPRTAPKKRMEDIFPDAYHVAHNIETMMHRNGDTMEGIAKLLNVDRSTLWRRLKKEPYKLSLMEMDILCKYWHIPSAWLFGDLMPDDKADKLVERLGALLDEHAAIIATMAHEPEAAEVAS